MRLLRAAVILLATSAAAQQQVSAASYWDRCYGSVEAQPNHVFLGGSYVGPPVIVDARPVVSGQTGGGRVEPNPPLSGVASAGEGAGYAVLVAAVVAAVALPAIVYALDNAPPPLVRRRFDCPGFAFDGWGGVEVGQGRGPWAGVAAARVRMGFKYFGSDVQFEASPSSGVGSFSAHGLIRPAPKEHIEGGLALGYKRAFLAGKMREGFEVGLPHQYTLWRSGGRELQIELRPGVFITTQKTVDVSVDLAVLIPVLEALSVRIGTRVYSFDGQPLAGFSAGLSLHL